MNANPAPVIFSDIDFDCEHDHEGPFMVFNACGQYFRDSDLPDPDVEPSEYEKFYSDNQIQGGCASCSKCGAPFTFNPFLFE